MKILMVLTSHDQLGNTGRKTGFWLEEFAAPYFVFRDAGVPENEVGSRSLFQPETGFKACIAKLVMRREHHQDLHVSSPYPCLWLVGLFASQHKDGSRTIRR